MTLPPPLASGARPGRPGDGDCTACGQPIGRGERVATLPDGSPAHVRCVAAAGERASSTARGRRHGPP